MRLLILPETIANWSSTSPGSSMRSFWVSALLMLLVLASFSGLAAHSGQSEDPTIAALKRGESTYFTAKMRNLSEQLHLDESQQKRLQPIAEQETAYIEQIRMNPVLSRKEKYERLREIVRASDKQMKPFLSVHQWERLESLRKEQKATLENYVKTK